jgi:hypothetical protein
MRLCVFSRIGGPARSAAVWLQVPPTESARRQAASMSWYRWQWRRRYLLEHVKATEADTQPPERP